MKGTKITWIPGLTLLVSLCIFGAVLPEAKADAGDQKTIFTFSGPVEIPGQVLPAGTYEFKLLDAGGDRDVVEISNKEGSREYGIFLTIPDYRMKPTGKVVITFEERAAGSPEAVKGWFYPGENYGHQFVYPKVKAVQLAKANNTPVPSMPDEVAANNSKENVVAMKGALLKAEKPNEEEVEVVEAFQVSAAVLPKTASELPLIGLAGLMSLGTAIGLWFAGAKPSTANVKLVQPSDPQRG